jgi:hypothetical protein
MGDEPYAYFNQQVTQEHCFNRNGQLSTYVVLRATLNYWLPVPNILACLSKRRKLCTVQFSTARMLGE